MKYLGILVVAALVLLGSVAMADLIASGDWGTLYGYGGINTSGNPNQNSYGPINCTLQVVVYPYLSLTIDHTQFYWHLTQALGSNQNDVYYPSGAGVQVAQVQFITNWPAINIAWSGIGWDGTAPSNLIPQWTLKSGNWWIGQWYDHQTIQDGSYTWPVQHQWQPPQHPTGDHYELFSRIKIPQGTKPSPGTYTDNFTITISMAQ